MVILTSPTAYRNGFDDGFNDAGAFQVSHGRLPTGAELGTRCIKRSCRYTDPDAAFDYLEGYKRGVDERCEDIENEED